MPPRVSQWPSSYIFLISGLYYLILPRRRGESRCLQQTCQSGVNRPKYGGKLGLSGHVTPPPSKRVVTYYASILPISLSYSKFSEIGRVQTFIVILGDVYSCGGRMWT